MCYYRWFIRPSEFCSDRPALYKQSSISSAFFCLQLQANYDQSLQIVTKKRSNPVNKLGNMGFQCSYLVLFHIISLEAKYLFGDEITSGRPPIRNHHPAQSKKHKSASSLVSFFILYHREPDIFTVWCLILSVPKYWSGQILIQLIHLSIIVITIPSVLMDWLPKPQGNRDLFEQSESKNH